MISDLLSRLQKVRQTSPSNWIACCPAHEDRQPSMAIRHNDDGRILLHDFGGCDVEQILSAIGLTLSDLFPPRPLDHVQRPIRRPFPAADVLTCVARDALVVQIAAAQVRSGAALSDVDAARVATASRRLQEAVDVARG